MNPNYYSEQLNATRLRRCYEVSPPRVQQFLEAEIEFVLGRINEGDMVLDLGCGYGRVAHRLIEKADRIVGIDISPDNIRLAKELYQSGSCRFYTMDAINLSFDDDQFDVTLCLQNGISAFKVDPHALVKEALRVTRPGGILLFSSYSGKFWDERLRWFEIQANEGLIGEIDYNLTTPGTIICKDGFKAVTYSADDFLKLAAEFDVEAKITEVDGSSMVCEMGK